MKTRCKHFLALLLLKLLVVTASVAQVQLVAHYPFSGNANDATGHGYNGTVVGATLCPDRSGTATSAYSFDGIDDQIVIGKQPNFPSWNTYAVSLWFLNDGGGDQGQGYGQKILSKAQWNTDFHLGVQGNNGIGYLTWWSAQGGFNAVSASNQDYRDNKWHHVVLNKKSPTEGDLWVDGVLRNSASDLAAVLNDEDLVIGYTTHTDGYQQKHWSGKIDDIRIYNGILSSSEILSLYGGCAVKTTFYRDADKDGFGNVRIKFAACTPPAGYVADSTDCNDLNKDVYPGATEKCDGLDNDCDGVIDDGWPLATFYKDYDKDGYGNLKSKLQACAAPPGYVADSTDCNDTKNTIHPGAPEECDNIDNDCDGLKDDSLEAAKQDWVARHNGPAFGMDGGNSITTDAAGNVYVTGQSTNTPGSQDIVTIKYNAAGTELWKKYYNGTGNSDDVVHDIGVDASGNVFITGRSVGSGSGHDYITIKYDAAGNEKWVKRYSVSSGIDEAWDLTLDASGNVYVTGGSAASSFDAATIKYDTNGNEVWIRRYNSPANSFDVTHSVAVDASGNVYVGGWTGSLWAGMDYLVIKYNAAGNQQWLRTYNGPAGNEDIIWAVGLDGSGNLYVTGASYGIGSDRDFATIKYDAAGNLLWLKRYNGTGNGEDYASAMSIDAAGNVYVSGHSAGSGSGKDITVVKYSPSGTELWARRYNGPANGDEQVERQSVAVGPSGNIYVAGSSPGTGTATDYATIAYDAAGNELWAKRYNGPGNDVDNATAVAADLLGNVYVTGYSTGTGTGQDIATVKYKNTYKTFYYDRDKDGYGNSNIKKQACTAPSGYVAKGGDCNDANAAVYPGATEKCDGLDNDCDGIVDDGWPLTTFYKDYDKDGYGNIKSKLQACAAPPGYVSDSTDCNDSRNTIHPGAPELINRIDDDCDGLVDESGPTVSAEGKIPEEAAGHLAVQVVPNPFHDRFTLIIRGKGGMPVQVRVLDALGNTVERRSNIAANSTLQLGQNYADGVYVVEAVQGSEKRTVKLVKQAD